MTDDTVSSTQVRDKQETLLVRDLLGPWDGLEEELPAGVPPSERYLLGRLVPRTPPPAIGSVAVQRDDSEVDPDDLERPHDPELVDRETSSTDDSGDTDVEPEATVRAGSHAASSVGLSFQVPADVAGIVVRASWGRYERTVSEYQETPMGRPSRVWKRVPAGGAVEVDLRRVRRAVHARSGTGGRRAAGGRQARGTGGTTRTSCRSARPDIPQPVAFCPPSSSRGCVCESLTSSSRTSCI